MSPLPFNLAWMEYLADHRSAFLTNCFLAATDFGSFDFYIFIIALFYVAWHKQLAIRLSVLLLLSSMLTGLLKIIIKNPRPFVSEGTYLKKWAVPAQNASRLVMEYSTPSGHAMSAAAFYSYLFALTRDRYFRVAAVAAIVLIGASRPYLGVHYVEDVLLGWAIGICCAVVFVRYFDSFSARWSRLSYSAQIGVAVAGSIVLWLISFLINGSHAAGPPAASLADTGFLTGIVIARPLELRTVNFDPRSSSVPAKVLRFLVTICMVIGTAAILDMASGAVSARSAMLGFALQYLRAVAAGFVTIYLAPWLFTKLRLAKSTPVEAI